MRWLICYEYTPMYRTDTGICGGSTVGMLDLIDQHPAVFLAENRREMAALEDAPYQPQKGPQRVDFVSRVFSVVEVPDGTLTDEQAAFLD